MRTSRIEEEDEEGEEEEEEGEEEEEEEGTDITDRGYIKTEMTSSSAFIP